VTGRRLAGASGGVYVLANIRGGGEFGPRWHQAALKENRQKAFDDFLAVAQDLIRRRLSSPRHLGIMGGSNGGLLVGAALTQRPELFNAVVCQVPLLDMRRYHQLLAGASWMGEYGDPDDPQQWAASASYSPYHNVSAGQALSARAVHHLDARRPRASRPCAQDGGADAGTGPRCAVLGKHRRRPCRRGQQ
jgi:prolyl oligopeptidase PreP (S9A serine peptidase family)